MNMRSYFGRGARAQAISYDGGETWTAPYDVPELVEPVCQASLIRYAWPGKDGKQITKKSVILFLNPASPKKRHNMTIRASYDEGKSWPAIRTLYPGPSAYSSMTVLSDKTVGVLYEAGKQSPYEAIRFEVVRPDRLFNE